VAQSPVTQRLVNLLGIEDRDVVAFVGGGGKSTLILGVGRELAAAGKPVVMATTTKMGVDQIPQWAEVCEDVAAVRHALEEGKPSYLLKRAEGAKVIGADPSLIDEVAATTAATIVVESDGSRGRPFKAPDDHEPVIPTSATLVVVVVGGDAIGRPIDEACHRPERVLALTGAEPPGLVTPEHIAAVAAHSAGGRKNVPPTARLRLGVTKVGPDLQPGVERIRVLLPADVQLVVIPHH